MKNRQKIIPLTFLIIGMMLITAITAYSIRKHVKNSALNSEKAENTSVKELGEKNIKTKDDLQLFFSKPEHIPSKTMIKIYKKKRVLELYGDENIIGRFKIGLGRSPEGDKEKEGDNKTPEGSYYICYRNGQTKYTYFLGLSYPNIKDAQNGLDKGLINKETYEKIKDAIDNYKQPPWNTPLGGAVGIHGGGNEYNWTYGCIAVSNEDVNIIKQYAPVKTPVEIYK
ncbi:murein L,D-transpeptidase family protein [Clostridium sp. DJ247]|uniref:L,D-transpeptidase family protein n=1 Tax=Clostridium sp. DJ247 TaxID=2726188 RepID=UPI00162A9731|nr:L,D-transpeptidase family protein [Clostridium sp. DJ247]MBC2582863.1 L,D-transpeptidase family protein [Clostridium sp. DJ247]